MDNPHQETQALLLTRIIKTVEKCNEAMKALNGHLAVRPPFLEGRSVWSRPCVNSVEGRRQHVDRPPVIVPSPPFRRTPSTPRERKTSSLPPGSLSTTTATSPTTSSGWSSRAPRRRRPRTPLLPPPCLPGRSRRTELPGQASPGACTRPDERHRSPAQVITSSTSQSGGSFDPPRRPTVLLARRQGAQMSVDRGWLGRGRSSGAHQGQSSRFRSTSKPACAASTPRSAGLKLTASSCRPPILSARSGQLACAGRTTSKTRPATALGLRQPMSSVASLTTGSCQTFLGALLQLDIRAPARYLCELSHTGSGHERSDDAAPHWQTSERTCGT
jgi:hypothetical protein